jgi:hypothetical protein
MSGAVEMSDAVPLLRALVNREIPDEEAREIFLLIHTQKEWDDAYQQVLLEKLRKIKGRDCPSS